MSTATTRSADARPAGTATAGRRPRLADRRSNVLTIAMVALLAYFLLPLFWVVSAST